MAARNFNIMCKSNKGTVNPMSRKLLYLQCGKICQQTEWRREISRKVIRRQIPAVAANQWKIKTSETNLLKPWGINIARKLSRVLSATANFTVSLNWILIDPINENEKQLKLQRGAGHQSYYNQNDFSHKKCMKENKKLEFANHCSLKLSR